MAKKRAGLSLKAVEDAITSLETAVRKAPVKANTSHLQFLDGLRTVVRAFCASQPPVEGCGDYCIFPTSAAPARTARKRKTSRR